MKKVTLLCLSPLVLAPLAFAGGQNAPTYSQGKQSHHTARPFTGLYVMGGMGAMIAGLEASQSATGLLGTSGLEPMVQPLSNDADLFQFNVAGELGVGYVYQFDNGIVLGAFATAGATDIVFENETSASVIQPAGGAHISDTITSDLTTHLDYDFALLLKPGYLIAKRTWLYGLLGPRWGHMNTTVSVSNVFQRINNVNVHKVQTEIVEASAHDSEYAIGFTAGVGIAQKITPHLVLGLEYAYTAYGELDTFNPENTSTMVLCANGPCAEVPFTIAGTSTIEPNTNTIMATLSYRFNF